MIFVPFLYIINMAFTVSHKEDMKKMKGCSEFKFKYYISRDGIDEYVALIVNNNLGQPILFDYKYDNDVSRHNWYIHHMGYVFNHSAKYMHQLISTEAQIPNFQNTNLSVDHIDRIKIDNRVKNLRMASQSEQNSNRDTRSDKKAPSEELTNAGISELPKYVRWDNSETKFVIDKHPQLIQEALGGKRKKAQMSGSKSSKLSIIEKYQDILARLEELD